VAAVEVAVQRGHAHLAAHSTGRTRLPSLPLPPLLSQAAAGAAYRRLLLERPHQRRLTHTKVLTVGAYQARRFQSDVFQPRSSPALAAAQEWSRCA
jgi:hypothetical protein